MRHQNITEQRPIPKQIFDLLEREVQLSHEMLDLLEAEKNALTAMDIQSLISLSRKKVNHLSKIQSVDDSLQETASQIAGLPSDTKVKLEHLASLTSGDDMAHLSAYRKKLTKLREQILDRNMINKHFAEDTKSYLNDAMSLITSKIAEKPMYGNKGIDKPSVKQPTLISREV